MNGKVEKISEAEAEIMRAVWGHDGPVTYSYIRSLLTEQKGWESPTVNTLVNRLVKKGILAQEKKEVYYYAATLSEKEYIREKTKAFIQKVYGGSAKGLVAALLTDRDITREEFNELREQWRKEEKKDE